MGKGKRTRQQRWDKVFKEANKLAQSRLPDYNEERFVREFKESGDAYSVMRYWMYIQMGCDPNHVNKRADEIIQEAIKMNGCIIDHKNDQVIQIKERTDG